MTWFLLGVAVGAWCSFIKRAVWCSSCVNGEHLKHTRECQIRHVRAICATMPAPLTDAEIAPDPGWPA